jgi:hypothetical protein
MNDGGAIYHGIAEYGVNAAEVPDIVTGSDGQLVAGTRRR